MSLLCKASAAQPRCPNTSPGPLLAALRVRNQDDGLSVLPIVKYGSRRMIGNVPASRFVRSQRTGPAGAHGSWLVAVCIRCRAVIALYGI